MNYNDEYNSTVTLNHVALNTRVRQLRDKEQAMISLQGMAEVF